jgi:hypothetical protein
MPMTRSARSSSPAAAARSRRGDISGGAGNFRVDASATEAPDYSDPATRDGGGILALRIFQLRKPIIAAINGPAIGIGATMLLPMDARLASDTARFGFVFARRGIVPEAASSIAACRHQPRAALVLYRRGVRRQRSAVRRAWWSRSLRPPTCCPRPRPWRARLPTTPRRFPLRSPARCCGAALA